MQDPMEPDRQEILTGPGDMPRPARNGRSATKKKTVIVAASALVAVLAAGGIGFALAGGPGGPAQPAPSTGQAGQASPTQTAADEPLDEEASMGDAKTDAPDEGLSSDEPAADMGDAVTDPDTSTDTDKGAAGTDSRTTATPPAKNGKKPTSSPTKPAQEPAGDNPADGPAGEVIGQCAKTGC
ncbi:hypothetical protein [Nonomuraea sp. NEAU-A123]|uniref:hypothetical protein n=1 Tax=Nonomuraea sp. NEAU-A123 TaxID=2839649 RepID=UPI001BE3D667|nr:hypothetical protein [Nonomuraea sp. NEAU-A123]MBT2229590.1 hypothetical protein [Nonomuraea sp. NEAU-A123]